MALFAQMELHGGGAGGSASSSWSGGARKFQRVEKAHPRIRIELRYATRENITGGAIYPRDMPCLLRGEAAQELGLAQEYLEREGYRWKVWDAYRPPKSTLALWEAVPAAEYVVSPEGSWSRYGAGAAVDVPLVDSLGREMAMPTEFDHFSPKASSTYQGEDSAAAKDWATLQRCMRRAGFATLRDAWWHFYDVDSGLVPAVSARSFGIKLPAHVARLERPEP